MTDPLDKSEYIESLGSIVNVQAKPLVDLYDAIGECLDISMSAGLVLVLEHTGNDRFIKISRDKAIKLFLAEVMR